ncbi:85e4f5bb-75b5-4bac-9a09-aa84823e6e4c [Thermothielavioides terrestris]|uniref:85e4f5bb-75b5-4bac-9a09-aa84823e6e4c n=1 Tax=Thermothielavioides terrestris TaxID=2587410 RepID=A0A3S5CXG3_9PEZI|nr:85e4f5bb-75b5-4bac-9a09-aa84823e6e4c [Thermothielavioides terrestris]
MAPAALFAATYLTAIACLASATSAPTTNHTQFGPSEAAARQNAFAIFNAVHSAMRQWGSSLNHNGMSFFLVTVPPGVILYHGTDSPDPPPGPEWLAFEIEHAENFARPRRRSRKAVPPPPPHSPPPSLLSQPAQQHPLHQDPIPHPINDSPHPQPLPQPPDNNDDDPDDDDDDPLPAHGYLHLYRTTAPLHLLYVDGMSAGNTAMGTLDTQDLLLRLNRSAGVWDEYGRATELCALAAAWGCGSSSGGEGGGGGGGGLLRGVLRMEAGFEVIRCDFADGAMELLDARQRPDVARWPGLRGLRAWEFVRAVAARYGGIGGGRVVVDWSSMVSALFYEVDLGNPDGRFEGLPRLVRVSDGELRGIRDRVAEVMTERARMGEKRVVDWQAVVDLVVSRYADRLRYLAEGIESLEMMRAEVNSLLDTHIDYAVEDEGFQNATQRCARHYTLSAVPGTQEDKLILTAIETVTHAICSALFEVRKLVVEDPEADDGSLDAAKRTIRGLMGKLRWSKWKECAGCAYDEWTSHLDFEQKKVLCRRNGGPSPKLCVSRESKPAPIDGNDGFYH